MPITVSDTDRSPAPPAELDLDTRGRLADAISRAITAELGRVRISSVPPGAPEPEPPRSSMRVAARYIGKGGKWSMWATGALSIATSVIVWTMRPEYAAPLGQALKLIAAVILAAAGGGAPAADAAPARDVPAISAPAPDAPP